MNNKLNNTTMTTGQTVEYKNPMQDEVGTKFRVLEVVESQNWALIQAVSINGKAIEMTFKPTYVANVSDLKAI